MSSAIMIIVFAWLRKIFVKFLSFRATEISFKNKWKSFKRNTAGFSGVNFSINSNACKGFLEANPLSLGFPV